MKYTLRIFLSTVILCSATLSWGQKFKYKDLFFLIYKSKKYDDGAPFLRSFLSNPKNADHANAHFLMAVIHENNAKKKNVLTENEEKIASLDSAIYFYSKSKTLVTEKEIKKNSAYYEDDFLRRDLRTGKMGIKVSDVHLDLDERVAKINGRIASFKSIDTYFSNAVSEYQVAFDQYNDLISKFETQRIFYLRANDEMIKKCDQIQASYTSAIENFNNYKLKIAEIEKSDYDQSLNVIKITDIKSSGDRAADFYAASVDVYDFSDWAMRVKTIVVDGVKPMKEQLLAYDQRLDNIREQLFKDSVSVLAKVEKEGTFYEKLLNYDKEAMPLSLLDLKQEELKYWSFIFENRHHKDSANVDYQITMASNEFEAILGVDSMANKFLTYNLTIEAENYDEYINKQYGGVTGVQQYIKQKLDFAKEEKKYRKKILETKQERSRWLIYGNDSIPLFEADSTFQLVHNGNTQYIKLGGSSSENPIKFTHGIRYDSLGASAVYVSVVPDSLRVSNMTTYDMNAASFSMERFEDLSVQQIQEKTSMLTYVLYYDSYPYEGAAKKSQLTCISASGTVLWSLPLSLAYPPDNLSLHDNGELAINYKVKYVDTNNSDQLISRLLISAEGKILN